MSGRKQRPIDAAAKEAFLDALRRGEGREDAAFAAGFSLMGLYGARSRDPVFKAGWTEALATSAASERRVRGESGRGEVRIACANRRIYQRRRRRNVRFDAAAQEIYLAHFAANCDTKAAAEAAGVHPSTVRLHRRTDPAFAEAEREALAQGYVFLECEAVRLRLEAQKRLRAAIDAADRERRKRGERELRPLPPELDAADEADFDRTMKLLARWDRQPRRRESVFTPGGRRQRWTFDRAIKLVAKKLKARGFPGPPEEAGRKRGRRAPSRGRANHSRHVGLD